MKIKLFVAMFICSAFILVMLPVAAQSNEDPYRLWELELLERDRLLRECPINNALILYQAHVTNRTGAHRGRVSW